MSMSCGEVEYCFHYQKATCAILTKNFIMYLAANMAFLHGLTFNYSGKHLKLNYRQTQSWVYLGFLQGISKFGTMKPHKSGYPWN